MEDDDLRVSAFNGPRQQTMSGSIDAIRRLEERLTDERVTCRRLRTSHAFHHPSMSDAAERLRGVLGTVSLRPPSRPFVSTVSGTWITDDQAVDPAFWASGVTEPVRFSSAVAALLVEPNRVLIDCGPGGAVSGMVRAQLGDASPLVCETMAHAASNASDRDTALRSLGSIWQSGLAVDWDHVWADRDAQRITLPTYRFQRQRYWVESDAANALQSPIVPRDDTATRSAPSSTNPNGPQPTSTPLPPTVVVPTWTPAPPAPMAEPDGAPWIVLTQPNGPGAALCERLAGSGLDVVAVVPGPGYHRHTPTLATVDLDAADDMGRLVADLGWHGRPPAVVNALTLTPPGAPLTIARGDEGVALGFRAPLALLQALVRGGHTPQRLVTLTSSLFNVSGNEWIDPVHAPALGITRVMAQEFPGARAAVVDVVWPSSAAEAAMLMEALLTELRGPGHDSVVAYRRGVRLVESYQQCAVPPAEALLGRIRPRGAYVITGGFGGIGGVLARTLASAGQPTLVMVGRRGLPQSSNGDASVAVGRSLVSELEQQGATVAAAAADVSDPEQVAALIRGIRDRFGPIAGVIHAAGVPGGGMMIGRELSAADAVFAPKVRGTIALLSSVAIDHPDFIVLCSSFASVAGGVGQSDYCGANAALDALAGWGRTMGLRVTSIGWPAWRGVGMAASMTVPSELESVKTASLASGIDPWDGARLFAGLVALDHAHVVVPPVATQAPPSAATMGPNHPRPAPGGRPTGEPVHAPDVHGSELAATVASTDAELMAILRTRLEHVWSEVLGAVVDEQHADFFELGGQSLMGLQIVARLSEEFPISIELADLLQQPTIPALAALIFERLSAAVLTVTDDEVRALHDGPGV
jgi:acyl transferase domain-containing protein